MGILTRVFGFLKDSDYGEGMRLYNAHLYREAIEKFERVIKKKASRASLYHNLAEFYCCYAHRNLGIMLFVVGNFADALREFEKGLCGSKNPHEIYHLMGICQNNLGDYENAVSTFSTILRNDPDSLPTKLRLGIALHNLKMWDKSVGLYSTILEQKPKYADVHFRLGLALLGQDKADLAVKAFSVAVSINPNYVEAHIKLGLTQAYIGDFAGALASFAAILARHPDFPDIYYAQGIVMASSGRLEEARASFEKAIAINPSYKDAKIKLGILLCLIGDFEAAAACLRAAGEIDPDDANLRLAISAADSIMARPSDARSMPDELKRLFGGGKPIEQAVHEFNAHLKIKPDLSAVLAIIKEFSQEDAALCEMLVPVVHDYVRDQPSYPDTHYTLGSIYVKLGKLRLAEESFRQALKINPDYLKARINLFNTLHQMGRAAEAAEQGEYIIARNVDYPDVYCNMGDIMLSLGRHGDALLHLEKAVRMRPRYGRALYLKGLALALHGRIADAEQAYEACLASCPADELGNSARQALAALRQQ